MTAIWVTIRLTRRFAVGGSVRLSTILGCPSAACCMATITRFASDPANARADKGLKSADGLNDFSRSTIKLRIFSTFLTQNAYHSTDPAFMSFVDIAGVNFVE